MDMKIRRKILICIAVVIKYKFCNYKTRWLQMVNLFHFRIIRKLDSAYFRVCLFQFGTATIFMVLGLFLSITVNTYYYISIVYEI